MHEKEKSRMNKIYEMMPHTADIKIRVYGITKKELFAHAIQAMFECIKPILLSQCTKNKHITCKELPEQHTIEVHALDSEALLVDFLSEALYLSDVHNEAYLRANIHELTNTYIRATLYGVKVSGFEVVEIKAVTYHDLALKEIDGVWQTDIVFDI